ncbi:NAD(P)H-quinone oxidoreductase [Cytophagaceae bacterium DM2B3-1]|uniref:NAD(P)H-quinone oxidoreductase n=1 Tax=Xanthocytophaga flava TaxID=3048013 RepID=A0ABT7CFA7_9BACT|nr:NAD(P)H-quinone oxidoreductase [Xanthocytophaga flavus]MDJ1492422.1 NAD(P)H-quinone oxidoreductase [Xanthocytophaga flavus]
MKAVVITQPGGPDVLSVVDRSMPEVGEGEVLVKVLAAGINRPDIAQRKGYYPAPAGAPVDIPGLEIAGIVEYIGAQVGRFKVGDVVCALVSGGGYAEYCMVPEGQCLPIPEGLNFVEAAALPETFFTVWSNVFDRGNLKPGESLLVHGGSSGIGTTAIQMATAMGSTVYVTAGTEEKCLFCEELGAVKAFNYKKESFKDRILDSTEGKGVDVILDMIGGNYTSDNLQVLAEDGRLVLINVMNGREATIDLLEVMRRRLTITGSTLRNRDIAFKSAIAQNLEKHIWPLISAGKIKPVIYQEFPVEEVSKAHLLMESSEHMGKIVLTFT